MTSADHPPLPDVVRRYFELAGGPDREAYLDLFAVDAVVEDEGVEHRGIASVRAWRDDVPLASHQITDVIDGPEGLVVTTTITGDFPGSPFAGLAFRFTEIDAANKISRLRIRP